MAFFSKTNVMIKFVHTFALFYIKNAVFLSPLFCKNIFKIKASVPVVQATYFLSIAAAQKMNSEFQIRFYLHAQHTDSRKATET
jgi:hypothetical protein